MPACRAGSVSTDRLCVLPEGDLCEPVTGGGQTQARTHPAASPAAIGSGRAARARVRLVLPSLAGPGGPWPAPRPVLAEGGVDPELWEPEPVGAAPCPGPRAPSRSPCDRPSTAAELEGGKRVGGQGSTVGGGKGNPPHSYLPAPRRGIGFLLWVETWLFWQAETHLPRV